MTRRLMEIVSDIDFIDRTDERLLQIHDRTLGENAVLRPGEKPLSASDYSLVREGLLTELGAAYMDQIHHGGK